MSAKRPDDRGPGGYGACWVTGGREAAGRRLATLARAPQHRLHCPYPRPAFLGIGTHWSIQVCAYVAFTRLCGRARFDVELRYWHGWWGAKRGGGGLDARSVEGRGLVRRGGVGGGRSGGGWR